MKKEQKKGGRIYRRDCGHVIVRKPNVSGKIDDAKLCGVSLKDSISKKEDCPECLRLEIEAKKPKPNLKEAEFVNKIKHQKTNRVVAIPRARMKATIDIKESHVDDRGITVVDRAELVSISLVPDAPFGKVKVHKPRKPKKK